MNAEALKHYTILGFLIAVLIGVSILFKNQTPEKRQKLFNWLLGFLAFGTLFLIFVGAMVASTRSGMAFMDWPTSDGLIWPGLDKWIHQEDMFWEHIHRLIAEGVGYVAICLLIWSFFVDDKKYVKACSLLLLLIILQGIFGGLTVKRMTAWWTSTLHGVVAQMVFCMMTVLFFSSRAKTKQIEPKVDDDSWLYKLPRLVCVVVLSQLILGASFRHKMKESFFSSKISNQQLKELTADKASLSFSHKGNYTVKVKVEKAAEVRGQIFVMGQKTQNELYKNVEAIDKLGEADLGEFEAQPQKNYRLTFNDEVKSIRLMGKKPVSIVVGGKSSELDFDIVYKEVLDGNTHLLWAHIAFAIVVTLSVLLLGMYLLKKKEDLAILGTLGKGMLLTILIQITLGVIAFMTVSDRQEGIYDQTKTILTSAHLANGALLLALCVVADYFCRKGFVKSQDAA